MAASIVRRPRVRCWPWMGFRPALLARDLRPGQAARRGPRARDPWRQYERRLRIEPISDVRIAVPLLLER